MLHCITTFTIEIQKLKREYCEKLYANNMENLEEINTSLEPYNLSSLIMPLPWSKPLVVFQS